MKNKFFRYILIIIGALYMSTSLSSNNFTNYKKPNFSIEFTAKRLGVEIRVNDIPAFVIENSGFMTLEIPVSEYIINGNNTITVVTHPLFDDNDEQEDDYIDGSSIEVGLYIREDDEPVKNRKIISKVLVTPNNSYSTSSKKPTAIFYDNKSNNNSLISVIKDSDILNFPLYGTFKKQVATTWNIDISSSFPRWQWQDGLSISNNESSYNSLVAAYTKIHEAFINKKIDLIKEISQQRSEELAIAYHLANADAGFEYSALGKYINHEKVKIYNQVFLDHTKFEIVGNGKLARIIDGGQIQPIVFVHDDTEQLYQAQFLWYLNKSNEWVLIR